MVIKNPSRGAGPTGGTGRESVGDSRISLPVVSAYLRAVDVLIAATSGIVCFQAYLRNEIWAEPGVYAVAVVMGLIVQQNMFHLFGVYRQDNMLSMRRQVSRLSGAWLMTLMILVLFAFLSKTSETYSRVWLLFWFSSSWIFFVMSRFALRRKIKDWIADRQLDQNVVVVGGGDQGRKMIEHLLRGGPYVNVVGFVDDRTDRVPQELAGVPRIGSTRDLLSIARRQNIDVILIAFPWTAEQRILEMVKVLWELPVEIRLSPEEIVSPTMVHNGFSNFYGVPVLNLLDRPLNDWQKIAKSVEDRSLALLALIFCAPLMLIIAAIIRLESAGPVLFLQRRYGFNNHLIEVYKFRSMYHDMADERADRITVPGDARVTRVGRFLRMFSLDELPQLINVLKGDMSLVGPRPHAVAAKAADRLYADVVDEYAARHRIKPGITGWAQVNGWRGDTDTEEKIKKRIEHDLYYIDNWSIWFDLKILILTFVEVLRARNAY
jgi:polysaccharide biosynthesis protein PslA